MNYKNLSTTQKAIAALSDGFTKSRFSVIESIAISLFSALASIGLPLDGLASLVIALGLHLIIKEATKSVRLKWYLYKLDKLSNVTITEVDKEQP